MDVCLKTQTINDNNILTQILKIADIYSALKENRSYKTSMNEEDTFKVLFEKAQSGEFDKKLVVLLRKIINARGQSQNQVIA